jgi:aminocarboxymuconate-semialdehyde decarboxylase
VPEELLEALRTGGARYGARLVRDERGGEAIDLNGRFRTRPVMVGLVDLPARLAAMDRAGVRRQAVSNWMDLSAYEMDAGEAERFIRLQNDTLANLVKMHPDRFVGLASVPLQDAERAAAELERAMQQLDFRGVEIGTNVAGWNLDDPALEPFWDAAESLGALVFIHPFNTLDTVTPRLRPYYFNNLIGNPLDTAIAAGSLIFGGVLQRHAGLKICLAHGGGHLPYQFGRMQHGFTVRPEARARTARHPLEFFKLLYFDSLTHSGASLEFLVKLVGAEHVLLGSDYPFDMAEPEPVKAVGSLPGLSDHDREAILFKNAERLLGLNEHGYGIAPHPSSFIGAKRHAHHRPERHGRQFDQEPALH